MAMPASTFKALRAARDQVAKWTDERNQLIADARAAGYSLREIGDAAGLSHTAVKLIADAHEGWGVDRS